jgi:hypothetical protein
MQNYLRSKPILLCALLLVLSACNYPRPQEGISGEELRLTLDAPGEPVQPTAPQVTPAPVLPTQATATVPVVTPPAAILPPPGEGYLRYVTRSGDTLAALAARFDVPPVQILLTGGMESTGYLPQGLAADIPVTADLPEPDAPVLPDGAMVYSPLAADFDLDGFTLSAGGYLSEYTHEVDGQIFSGPALIRRVSAELSVDPRLLLALLELRSGWVYGGSQGARSQDYPIGFGISDRRGLYQEIQITATQLNVAYYGWREGSFQTLRFQDGRTRRIDPRLNAGSVAVQHLLAILNTESEWVQELDAFEGLYLSMFGDPWAAQAQFDPLLPHDLAQPALELPFAPAQRWSLTAGPHNAWNAGTPRGALDFSPVTAEPVCAVSSVWVTASSPGVIARAAHNAVVLDLDGDGRENTGWVVVYFHLARSELIQPGGAVALDDPLGHPSCEGGRATGKHVHVARKYNGEWIPADGPVPFTLSGWQAQADERNYYGYLVRGDELVSASPVGSQTSIIMR